MFGASWRTTRTELRPASSSSTCNRSFAVGFEGSAGPVKIGLGVIPLDVEQMANKPVRVESWPVGRRQGATMVVSIYGSWTTGFGVIYARCVPRGWTASAPGVMFVKRTFGRRDVCGIRKVVVDDAG